MRTRSWNKFHAKRTEQDGMIFASKLEARRWNELRMLERAGAITGLQRQIPFDLAVNGHHICRYIADFVYVQTTTGERVTEDAKGVQTPEFKLKAKLMEAIHGIVVQVYTGRHQWELDVNKGKWLRRTRTASSPKTLKAGTGLRQRF